MQEAVLDSFEAKQPAIGNRGLRVPVKPQVLPNVVIQILQITASGRDDAQMQLEKAISLDAGFAARMLSVSNSAMFQSRGNITTIKQAIMVMGLTGIRNLALTVSVDDLFQCSTREDHLRARMWWRFSCDSAVCAKWVANERRIRVGDEAYLSAIFHSVGKMQFLQALPNSYKEVEELLEKGVSVTEAEQAVYGTDHVQLTIQAIHDWKLPDTLAAGVCYLTAPEHGDPHAGLRAATAIGIAIGHPTGKDGRPELPEWALEVLGIGFNERAGLVEEGRCALAAASRAA
jgi:HD-like signal output (HDOD) protein